ncbi:hypothetical protein L9F63_006124, partial [Diploptera punctata]
SFLYKFNGSPHVILSLILILIASNNLHDYKISDNRHLMLALRDSCIYPRTRV